MEVCRTRLFIRRAHAAPPRSLAGELSATEGGDREAVAAEAARQCFSPQRLASVLHRVELSLRHVSSNLGLAVLNSVSGAWVHSMDIERMMTVTDKIGLCDLAYHCISQ